MKILFVENHAVFASVVCAEFLSKHEVEVVPSIALAREKLAGGLFDLVLVDFDLDDGKGDELVREVKARFPALKAIGVSAHDHGNNALQEAGADAICRKADFEDIRKVMEGLHIRDAH